MEQLFNVIGFGITVVGAVIAFASVGDKNLPPDRTGYVAGSVLAFVGILLILIP